MATSLNEHIRENLDNKKYDGVIQGLRDALQNKGGVREPWTSGIVTLPEHATPLFYERQDGTSSSLKLGLITEAQAHDLSCACSPATFGLNNQDVLDESYRKAGKLDAGKFAWLFSPSSHGDFATHLVSGLFPPGSLDKGIRFELYKLNVYGEGSFFKAHQDTPRGGDMFGSLVCLLPNAHEGGNLLLRHRGRKFTFDGQALLQESPPASIAWVAFFSDVEHEVAKVTSGHRITVTFNLYFDSHFGAPIPQDSTMTEHPFKSALKKLIEDPLLSLSHPILGFGLEYAYPFQRAISRPSSIKLKGNDATLIQTLSSLPGVGYHFFLLYREEKRHSDCPFRILSNRIIDGIHMEDIKHDVFGVLANQWFLVWDQDPELAESLPPRRSEWWDSYTEARQARDFNRLDVEWVTEPSEENLDRSVVLAYGNEASLGYYYHQLCVVATIVPRKDVMKAALSMIESISESDDDDEDVDNW